MPISREHNLIFVHIPRNSGTSVIEALDMDYCRHYKWKYHYRNHHRLWRDGTTFTITRNPYERAVSTYEYIKLDESYWHSVTGDSVDGTHKDYNFCNNHTFKETIDELHTNFLDSELSGDEWEKQVPFIYNEDRLMVDEVLRFENLPSCFDNLMQKCNIDVTLPKLNSSDTNNYEDYYDKLTREWVWDIYERDFSYLDY